MKLKSSTNYIGGLNLSNEFGVYILVMYSSLFFGEPSWAEPSQALWFQKPSQNEPDFFLRSVDTEIKADVRMYGRTERLVNWNIILDKHITGA